MRILARMLAASVLAAFIATTAWAQNARVRGTIEKIDGDILMVKSRDNSELKLKLKAGVAVRGVVKATLADVKAGVYVGITSMPQADGNLKALEIHIFPSGQRVNENHFPWDLIPNSMMTNGKVEMSVAAVDGQVLTVTYKAGNNPPQEKKILVTPQTVLAKYDPATKADLKVGQKIFVANAPKLPDGTLEVASIAYGKEIPPPM